MPLHMPHLSPHPSCCPQILASVPPSIMLPSNLSMGEQDTLPLLMLHVLSAAPETKPWWVHHTICCSLSSTKLILPSGWPCAKNVSDEGRHCASMSSDGVWSKVRRGTQQMEANVAQGCRGRSRGRQALHRGARDAAKGGGCYTGVQGRQQMEADVAQGCRGS